MEGYAKTAHFMGLHDDHAIVRQFKSLSMRNLLYLQAEILHIEEKLSDLAKRDMNHKDRKHYTNDWWSLSQGEEVEDREQWEVALELREKLDKYQDAVLKHTTMLRLKPPNAHDLGFLRSWFENPNLGCFPLLGLDRTAWDASNEDDLIVLNQNDYKDAFSRWFHYKVIPAYHATIGRWHKGPTVDDRTGSFIEYQEATLAAIIRVMVTVIASVLPLCSIVILFFVTRDWIRLVIVILLSICFSLALSLLTHGRTIEIFAATSAFAAVNVVYLTGNCPSLTCSPNN